MARDGLRSHLSGSLPVSIAVHLVALLLFFVIPLVANVVVPTVVVGLPEFRVAPVPPPPEVLVRPLPRSSQQVVHETASPIPTSAPAAILPEAEAPRATLGPDPIGATDGLPSGSGATPWGLVSIAPPRVPDPPRQTGPVRAADLPVPPRKTVDVRPIYPDIARMARVEGTVVMEAVLDPSGRVTQLRVIKSVPMLDAAALEAVRQWRYTPTMYGGRPVSVLMTITMNFKLQ